MKADLISAYAASIARVASWAVVAGLVYRCNGPSGFAAISLLRAIMSAVALSGLGLAPALVILLPQFRIGTVDKPMTRLEYEAPHNESQNPPDGQLLNAAIYVVVVVSLTAFLTFSYLGVTFFQHVDDGTRFWFFLRNCSFHFTAGTLLRIGADVTGTRLQTDGRIAQDNALQAGTELLWVLLSLAWLSGNTREYMQNVSDAYLLSNVVFTVVRLCVSRRSLNIIANEWPARKYLVLLLRTGSVLMVAQIADLLYGPANQAMIQSYLSSYALATYAPLLHIDAALLLGVGGLATLLLPKTAVAMGERNPAAVRRYYVNGTLASFVLLAAGAAAACVFGPALFRLWFNDPMPATVALMPLVMVHTVIGGSAGVGRSILFGLNRAKAYTAAALVGGVANVGLAILLVTHTSLGLKAIVLATIITVAVRCGIWMPWYILKTLRHESARFAADDVALASAPGMP